MAFKVRATVVAFLGDPEKYPCHFLYKIGDEIIYDGEQFIGKICPALVHDTPLMEKMMYLYCAGPRYTDMWYPHPFWYAPGSVSDPSLKKYDGRGFRNVLETRTEPPHHMANLLPNNAWKWPPHPERTVCKDPMVTCTDYRTTTVLKLEAFDLCDHGYDVPFYRREMTILGRILAKQRIEIDRILGEFSKEEIEGIYPALSQMIIPGFVEELELMGYVDVRDGMASVTAKGQAKLKDFIASLSAEEREALRM
jgi:hypothetical protein